MRNHDSMIKMGREENNEYGGRMKVELFDKGNKKSTRPVFGAFFPLHHTSYNECGRLVFELQISSFHVGVNGTFHRCTGLSK